MRRIARFAILAAVLGSAAACQDPMFMATGRFSQVVGPKCVYCEGGSGARTIPPFATARAVDGQSALNR
ncbi:MAG: hypothetical protein JO306_05990 [Gemmatimonadetes bacterium]|nr:hypothetical protein [Gemmatimonadota bacterium]